MDTGFDPSLLQDLVNVEMPFGRYQGRLLADLPEPYLVWFANNGFPNGKLGTQLSLIYQIKVNGLEYLLQPLRQPNPRAD
ncbi:DUF3820 family protein [Exilibacterium tricleocarpae]|uniref:DUF3820 family protein n=1 Tax=Exilibacterium tricleocarpae TaxID=2591008 RepID=A0A545U9Z9_9GAMM|nr:DUF3820 family protein [Exilibacterium tricleocarpae]TQV86292.1 DUF3820 family protein [Exilibacterium tricleocarpae]